MDKEDMSVIRRNRIAIGLAAGLAVVLGLGVWSATGSGSNNSKPVAQTETDLGVLGDYGDVGQPPVLQEPAAAPETPVQQQAPETPAAQPAAQPPAAAPVSSLKLVGKPVDKMGLVVQDGDGRTMYRFDKDTPKPEGKSNCNNQCAVTWPPLLSDTVPQVEGIDPKLVSLITRADGKKQVAIDGWALYAYSQDPKPGAWKGQGVGGTWFVIQPDGKRNVECLPPGVTAPAA
ncbi:Predicted lipoprotein with conserved Yx(FWY)xxD motif [Lentzea jiangxiensis]|uniref:Predicted lipoprotein with conserved Yx(FWY)xxD motif n=2 Tax=Lentzea TaxID=165301 RepID=A0A1H0GWP5_9PSEU|nr:Predicted lipoprotein with conserved Yx(FWY)xxD motif [Lentzea jiangxiensis]